MKRLAGYVIAGLLISGSVSGQMSGISGSKLGAYNSDPISHNTIEFEPVIESGWSKMRWDHKGERVNLFSTPDSIQKYTLMSFRMTYGITPSLEAGVNISGDFEMISFAFKQKIISREVFSSSLIGGLNYVAGNQVYGRASFRHIHNAVALGVASTIAPSDRFSIDMDFQMEPGLKSIHFINDYHHFYSNIDAGYYFKGDFQLIGGLSWAHIKEMNDQDELVRSSILRFNPGFTVERGANFIIVGGFPFCIAGKNYNCSAGFMLALTIIIK